MIDALRQPTYTAAAAARYARLSPSQARAWLRGHSCGDRHAVPLVRGGDGAGQYASFLDFMELVMVRELVSRGIAVAKLRHDIIPELRALLGSDEDHLLATKRFYTHGPRLFLECGPMIELGKGGQLAIPEVVMSIADMVEFDKSGFVDLYRHPCGHGAITMDPHRAWGAPIVRGHRLKTSVIHGAFEAEGREVQKVAWWYDISEDEVKAAVAFEQSIREPTSCRRPSRSTKTSRHVSQKH